jgi:hypothetical protein
MSKKKNKKKTNFKILSGVPSEETLKKAFASNCANNIEKDNIKDSVIISEFVKQSRTIEVGPPVGLSTVVYNVCKKKRR